MVTDWEARQFFQGEKIYHMLSPPPNLVVTLVDLWERKMCNVARFRSESQLSPDCSRVRQSNAGAIYYVIFNFTAFKLDEVAKSGNTDVV